MVYDAMEYGSQVREAATKHKKKKDFDNKDEFLSGFKKSDKLTPVITLTVYWGPDEWDAPSVINTFTGIQLSVDEKGGKVNMCKGWDDHKKSGMDLVSKLNVCLIQDGRADDILRASTDTEYRDELIQYYGLDKKKETVDA